MVRLCRHSSWPDTTCNVHALGFCRLVTILLIMLTAGSCSSVGVCLTHFWACAEQVQDLQTELQQRTDMVATLDAQLLESNEMVADLKQASPKTRSPRVSRKQHKKKSGPGAVASWVVKAGVTVGGTLLAGQAVQHYQGQQPKK